MKIRILLLFSLFVFFREDTFPSDSTSCTSKKVDEYLYNFFEERNYSIFKSILYIKNRKMYVALHFIDKNKKMFDNGIVYEIKSDRIITHLYIKKNKIYNRKDRLIFDTLKYKYKFTGWQLNFSVIKSNNPKLVEFGNGFNFIYIADKGKTVADGPRIKWNYKDKLFQVFIFDDSFYE